VTVPAGPETHRGGAGDVGMAGGWPMTTNLRQRSSVDCDGNGDSGGDSDHGESIPLAGRLRAARRTFSEHRGSTGGRGMATLGGGHGVL
jgi:hypothetical protein